MSMRRTVGSAVIALMVAASAEAQVKDLVLTPETRIGAKAGDPNYDFTNSFVRDAARLPDGRIVVATYRDVRWYDATGRHLTTTAMEGRSSVEHLLPMSGDTVAVFDGGGTQKLIFAGDGKLVRAEPAQKFMGRMDLPIRHTSDGTLPTERLLPNGAIVGYYGDFGETGQWALTRQYLLTRGQDVLMIAEIPEHTFHHVGEPSDPAKPFSVEYFGATPYMSVGPDRVYLGNSGKPEIMVFRWDGTQLPTIRLDRATVNVKPADVDSAKARQYRETFARVKRNGQDTTRMGEYRAQLDRTKSAAVMPYYGRFVASEYGELWVPEITGQPTPVRWSIFDANGKESARVTLPARFSPSVITRDHVVGVGRTEDGSTLIQSYRITRPR